MIMRTHYNVKCHFCGRFKPSCEMRRESWGAWCKDRDDCRKYKAREALIRDERAEQYQ